MMQPPGWGDSVSRSRLEAAVPPLPGSRVDLRDYLPILVYLLGGLLVGGAILGLSMIGPKRPGAVKSLPYESGILGRPRPAAVLDRLLPHRDAVHRLRHRACVLLSARRGAARSGAVAVVELLVFVAVLAAALGYVWRKGALEWR